MGHKKFESEELETISFEEVINTMFPVDTETKRILDKFGIVFDVLEIDDFDK